MPIYKDEKRKTYYISEYINKKRVVRRGFKSSREAKSALDLLRVEKVGISKETTLEDIYTIFIEDYKLNSKGNTIKVFETAYNLHLKEYFKGFSVKDITSIHILSWKRYIHKKGLSTKTLNIYYDKLRVLLLYAVNHLGLPENPCDKVKKFKDTEVKDNIKFITYKDFFKKVELVKDENCKTAFKILFLEGMRIGELQALQVKDINFNFNKITINKNYGLLKNGSYGIITTKTSTSNRIIDMLEMTQSLIKSHIKTNQLKDNDFLFNKTTRKVLWLRFKECFPDLSLHNLRHSHISWLLSLKVDMQYIAQRVGHKDMTMIQKVYGHLYEDTKKEALKTINNASRDTIMIRKNSQNSAK